MHTTLTPVGVAWDARLTGRRGLQQVSQRRRARLADLIDQARARSTFYAGRYRGLPSVITDFQPAVPKARQWTASTTGSRTERSIGHLEHWIGDLSHLGREYVGAPLMARRQRAMPWRANRLRLLSALSPIAEIVEASTPTSRDY